MVRINRVVTRTGDTGTTGLVGGERVSKGCDRIESCGSIDEINAELGVARVEAVRCGYGEIEEIISALQNDLFDVGAALATPPTLAASRTSTLSERHVERVEALIEKLRTGLPELTSFVLPGGTVLNAAFHCARTACRRAERNIVRLAEAEEIQPAIIPYLNRLGDLLFILARCSSARAATPEFLWRPGGGLVDK